MTRDRRPVLATYRLQLNAEFTFADAQELVPYLAQLGVSHLYLSPLLTARDGSTHGYDVVDPSTVSAALGGEEGLVSLAQAASDAGLGLVVDIVPNHLGTGAENQDWQYLLAEGQSGEGGRVFDVDWDPPLPGAKGKVILPVLGDHYGKVLHNGELRVVEAPDDDGRTHRLCYHERSFPLSPESLEALERVGRIDALTGTPGEPQTWSRLHSLLEQQHYRLVSWRVGDRLINYRRFFAVSDLAGVRVEDEHVFDRTHRKILDLVERGVIDGLRVDHPDGLRDPARYLQRLAERTGGIWTVVEKITHPGERLEPWATAGTTGYEFCNDVLGLFVDPAAESVLDELDRTLGGDRRPYAEQVAAAKHEVLANDLAAEAARLARRLWALAQTHLQIRDLDDRHCLAAVSETLVGMSVYRSYVDVETGEATERDRATIGAAIDYARSKAHVPGDLLEFLNSVLVGEAGSDTPHLDFLARFQQLSGALMAKGVEDTVFYRYLRLAALNEVGGDPRRFGISVEQFHERNMGQAEQQPAGMLTTATHDTKRGEDVRLRIAGLTEIPDRWAAFVRATAKGSDLDGATASLLLQTMVGVWPLLDSGEGTGPLTERLTAYAQKASREAGVHTNWYDPDEAYERRLSAFLTTTLHDFATVKELAQIAEIAAEIGMVSSLAQVVLRTLSPGVPDTYQGNELWDDSLVDPDNRRPVDWQARREILGSVEAAAPPDLWESRRDGRIKLWVLHRALQARRALPGLVGAKASYTPLGTGGAFGGHVVAFGRGEGADSQLLAVVPVLPGAVMGPDFRPPLGDRWGDTTVTLPPGEWNNLLGSAGSSLGGDVPIASLFADVPVAVLGRAVQR